MMTSPLCYAPRRRAIGFVEMAREIGRSSPQSVPGEEGRRGPGSPGAVATGHDSDKAIRKSRTAHRQFTGPSLRAIISANDGSISPFLGALSPAQRIRGNRVRNTASIRAREEVRHARRWLAAIPPLPPRESRAAPFQLTGSILEP